ncbi:MAG: ribonuclease P protein component [Candidatus Margulisiibacteriota bacterium]
MLPKDQRIVRGDEIKQTVRNKQFHFASPLLYFSGRYSKNDKRVVVICSGKVGNAVTRNRIKRQIVGAYGNIRHNIAKNIDMAIMPQKSAATNEYQGALEQGLKQAKLWQE